MREGPEDEAVPKDPARLLEGVPHGRLRDPERGRHLGGGKALDLLEHEHRPLLRC